MNLLQSFSWRRAVLFWRRDLLETWRVAVVAMLVILGYMLFSTHVTALGSGENNWDYTSGLLQIAWPLLLLVSSFAFAELGDKARNEDFLLLPVSLAEKFLVRLVSVLVILPLALALFYTVATLLVGLSLWPLYGFKSSWSDITPNWRLVGNEWRSLFLVQSICFLGAVWFRKWHLLRTILAVLLIIFVMAALLQLAVFLLFYDKQSAWSGFSWGLYLPRFLVSPWVQNILEWFGILLCLLCWFLAWLRFCEVQSSDGI